MFDDVADEHPFKPFPQVRVAGGIHDPSVEASLNKLFDSWGKNVQPNCFLGNPFDSSMSPMRRVDLPRFMFNNTDVEHRLSFGKLVEVLNVIYNPLTPAAS